MPACVFFNCLQMALMVPKVKIYGEILIIFHISFFKKQVKRALCVNVHTHHTALGHRIRQKDQKTTQTRPDLQSKTVRRALQRDSGGGVKEKGKN